MAGEVTENRRRHWYQIPGLALGDAATKHLLPHMFPKSTEEDNADIWLASFQNGQFEKLCPRCLQVVVHKHKTSNEGPLPYMPLVNVQTLRKSEKLCALCKLMLIKCSCEVGFVQIDLNASLNGKGSEWAIRDPSGSWTYFDIYKGYDLHWKLGKASKIPPHIPARDMKRSIDDAIGTYRQCLKHPKCGRGAAFDFPTRILDVGSDTSDERRLPKIVLGTGLSSPYVALSYRWGGQQPLELTLETLPRFMQGIEMAEFPVLFQDAIHVTRAFGIQYLWIDAICIIQPHSDDKQDWKCESPRMGSVYGGSAFTISATDCCNPRESLFAWEQDKFVRIQRNSTHYTVGIPKRTHAKNSLSGGWSQFIDGFPISSRAWTLQERFLPPAILHFYGETACWECRTGVFGPGQVEFAAKVDNATPELKLIISPKASIHPGEPHQWWYWLIEQYHKRAVTDIQDRLPAIGGLAEHFARKNSMTYVAGLWENDIPRGLVWLPSYAGSVPLTAPRNPNSPTWSWASTQSPIDYHFGVNTEGRLTRAVYVGSSQAFNVKNINVKAPHGAFGQIEEGLIVAETLIHKFECRINISGEPDAEIYLNGKAISCAYDERPSSKYLWLMLVGAWTHEAPYIDLSETRTYCLILQQLGLNGSYFRRVGIGWFSLGQLQSEPYARKAIFNVLKEANRRCITLS